MHLAVPDPTPTHPARPQGRSRRIATLAMCSVLLACLAASGNARPQSAESLARCGARPDPVDVLRRLNRLRSQGAVCHETGSRLVASPLRWSDSLAAVAAAQSHDMAELRHMRHRDMLDRGLGERLTAAGYRFRTAVENVAVGYDSLDEVVEAWLQSEGHCENMMNQAVLELGLACSDDASAAPQGEGRYWTLVLGAPPRSAR